MSDKQSVLVTGGTGFVGSAVIAALLHEGFSVLAVTRDTSKNQSRTRQNLVWIAWEDVTATAFRGVDAVIHLATAYGRTERVSEVYLANVVRPLRLFEMALDAGVRRFINTGSYFDRAAPDYPYLREYRESKRVLAGELERLADSSGDALFVEAQLEHPYGSHEPKAKFCAQVIDSFLFGSDDVPCTLGEQQRDFIHVEDVAAAYVSILQGIQRRTGHLQIEVGTGVATSIKTFIETVAHIAETKVRPIFGALPYRDHEIMCSVAAPAILQSLGWQPRYDVQTGLNQVISTLRNASLGGPTSHAQG